MLSTSHSLRVCLVLQIIRYQVKAFAFVTKVTANTNLGTWLNDEYGDRTKMSAVLDRVVMDRPCKEPIPGLVAIEPLHTLNECFIGIDQLDYGQNAKHGCC